MQSLIAGIVFEQQAYLPWFVGIGLLGMVFTLWTYRRFEKLGSWKIPALLLKCLGIALLVFCLLEPLLTKPTPAKGANIFALMLDQSRSLDIREVDEEKTRAEKLGKLLDDEELPWLKALDEDFKFHPFGFGERLRRLRALPGVEFDERSSAFFSAFNELRSRYENQPLAGVLLPTDGLLTDIPADFADLLDDSAPVYPINLAVNPPRRDCLIRQVVVTESAFEDAPVTLSVEAVFQQFAGRKVNIHVFNEAGDQLDQAIVAVPEDKDDYKQTIDFELKPEEPGVVAYRVELSERPDESADAESPDENDTEATAANNRRWVVAHPLKGPYSLLYINGRLSWEYKFLRRALEGEQELRLVALNRVAEREPKFQFKGREGETGNPLFRGFGKQDDNAGEYDKPVMIRQGIEDEDELKNGEFPTLPENLYPYSAIVIDRMEAEFFSADQQNLIERYVSHRGGSLVMLGGRDVYRHGKYTHTPIADVLPLFLDSRGDRAPENASFEYSREGFLEPWNRLRRSETEEKARLADMPSFKVVNRSGVVKPGATVLAYQRDFQNNTYPVLVTQPYGRGKSVALLIGDLWRWGFKSPEHHADLDQFWRQLFRWTVVDVPRRVSIDTAVDEGRYPPEVTIETLVYDEEFNPDSEAEVALDVTGPDGVPIEIKAELAADKPGVYTATYLAPDEGVYRVNAVVNDSEGEAVGATEEGWAVNHAAHEFSDLRGNALLLDQLASATGGEVIDLKNMDRFVDELSRKPLPVMETSTTPIWHSPLFFLLAMACLMGEWFMKRMKGVA